MESLIESSQLPQSASADPIELKKLSERHKLVAALLAQGAPREAVAVAAQYTPEYITWLQRQPLFKEYIKEMSEAASVHLEAMFTKSVSVISEAMDNGTYEERLKGAKLQMEATGRIGRYQTPAPVGGSGDRLEELAERLTSLLHRQRSQVYEAEDAEVLGEQKRLSQSQTGA